MIKITIDKKTPSVNHIYGHNRLGHFYLKKEGKELREYIIKLVKDYCGDIEKFKDTPLSVTVEVFENWYTKKGTIKKKDVANREKFLIDSVFKGLGLDDSFIFEHTMFKVQSETEQATITITDLS